MTRVFKGEELMKDAVGISAKLRAFGDWTTFFDLGGGISTKIRKDSADKVFQERLDFIFPKIENRLGPFSGLTVLDVGCFEGYYSIEAAKRGAKRVVGLDPRPDNVGRAQLVGRTLGLENLEFRVASVYDLCPSDIGLFDVVLCMGLMYHLHDHLRAIQALHSITERLLIVDTQIFPSSWPVFWVKSEDTSKRDNSTGPGIVMIPSVPAVTQILAWSGFRNIERVHESHSWVPKYYRSGAFAACIFAFRDDSELATDSSSRSRRRAVLMLEPWRWVLMRRFESYLIRHKTLYVLAKFVKRTVQPR